jgi:hypothetical protein
MDNLTKEILINKVFCSDPRWTVTEGYMKIAQGAINPVIEEYENRMKSDIVRVIRNTLHTPETWSEAVKKQVPFEQTKAYVDGYNDAVSEMERRVNAYVTYLEDLVNNALKLS